MNVRDPETPTPSTPTDDLDAWLADDTVVATLNEPSAEDGAEPLPEQQSESEPEQEPKAEPVAEQSATATGLDPVSAWLLRVALALVIVVLVLGAAMVIYFITAEKAPRTAVERDMAAAEIAVRERPSDATAWQKLAYAQARAGRYDEALKTVRAGRTSTRIEALLLPEADILRAAGRNTEAVATYGDAITVLSREESVSAAAQKDEGVAMAPKTNALTNAYYGRSLAHKELGEKDQAIKDMLMALSFAPKQSDMRVILGDLYAETGQETLAKQAYTEALRYVPDSPGALAGLKRLGEAD